MSSVSRLIPGDGDFDPAAWAASAKAAPPADSQPSPGEPDVLFGKEGITFHDVLEMVNPLQHLPIIGTIYRELTGDEPKPGVRLVGGALFGGPVGLIGAGINNAIEYHTGRDIGGEIIAVVTGRPMMTDAAQARLADYKAQHAQVATDTPPADSAATLAANAVPAVPAVATDATAPVRSAPLHGKGSIGVPPVPAFPGGAMPPGLAADTTGITGKAGLPSAGSITPAAIVTQLGQQPQAAGGLAPGVAAALPVAASIGGPMVPPAPGAAQLQAEEAARQQAAQESAANAAAPLRIPARVAIEPRLPGPGRNNAARAPIIVPADAVTASAASQTPTAPASDAPIILGTPNAAPATLTPTAQIPDAMLRALDKYDALIKNRRGGKLDQTS